MQYRIWGVCNMVKRAYGKGKRLQRKRRHLLDEAIKIIEKYERGGYRITVRQVFYQMVTLGLIDNNKKEYDRIVEILVDGRMSGEIDWGTVVDRARRRIMPNQFSSMKRFVSAVMNSFRKPRWEDQIHYIEVMVEKEALAGILEPIAKEYHVSLIANKGYSSASAVYGAALRIKEEMEEGKICHVLYLGDHDPSGVDMGRDIKKRLTEFECKVEVEGVALTMEQIRKYNLPSNTVKTTDSRSTKYIKKYGNKSWELDALNPEILTDLLKSSILVYLDEDKYYKMQGQEEAEKTRLQDIVDRLDEDGA